MYNSFADIKNSNIMCIYNSMSHCWLSAWCQRMIKWIVQFGGLSSGMQCHLVDCCQHFGETCSFYLHFYLEFSDNTFTVILDENFLLIHHLKNRVGHIIIMHIVKHLCTGIFIKMVNGGYLICMIILYLGKFSSVLLAITLHGITTKQTINNVSIYCLK